MFFVLFFFFFFFLPFCLLKKFLHSLLLDAVFLTMRKSGNSPFLRTKKKDGKTDLKEVAERRKSAEPSSFSRDELVATTGHRRNKSTDLEQEKSDVIGEYEKSLLAGVSELKIRDVLESEQSFDELLRFSKRFEKEVLLSVLIVLAARLTKIP